MNNPSAPTVEMLSGGMVTVEVGTPPTTFMVHENLVVARSGFFKGALNGHFKESETRKVPLPEDNEELFTCLIHWLYTGTLESALVMAPKREQQRGQSPEEETPTSKKEDSESYEGSVYSDEFAWPDSGRGGVSFDNWDVPALHSGPDLAIGLLFELWILADKVRSPDLQKDVTKKIVDLGSQGVLDSWSEHAVSSSTPSDATLEYVYENTISTSPLRRLATDLVVVTRPHKALMSSMQTLSEDIVRDVGRTSIELWKAETRHHDHGLTHYLTDTHTNGGYTFSRTLEMRSTEPEPSIPGCGCLDACHEASYLIDDCEW